MRNHFFIFLIVLKCRVPFFLTNTNWFSLTRKHERARPNFPDFPVIQLIHFSTSASPSESAKRKDKGRNVFVISNMQIQALKLFLWRGAASSTFHRFISVYLQSLWSLSLLRASVFPPAKRPLFTLLAQMPGMTSLSVLFRSSRVASF